LVGLKHFRQAAVSHGIDHEGATHLQGEVRVGVAPAKTHPPEAAGPGAAAPANARGVSVGLIAGIIGGAVALVMIIVVFIIRKSDGEDELVPAPE
jgi:hypothetical protein